MLVSAALLAGLCCVSSVQAQARFSYSTDGAEVTDSKTGLIWQRCSAGQTWMAGTITTCGGTAAGFTHDAALSYAKSQTGWRLPNVKELSSITDKTRIYPAIDVTAFPATQSSWFWTSTPYAANPSYAWFVDFYGGYVDYDGRGSAGHVRLVR
jgi:hypothetical protein